MKKITQNLFFFMLTVLSMSSFAQTTNSTGLPGADLIFFEDMRFYKAHPATPASGYLATVTAATIVPAGNSTIPEAGTDAGQLGYTRPANNYPAGDAIDSKSVKLTANNGSANHDMDVWLVVNSVDLSGYDSGSKYFTFSTRTSFREDGTTNLDDDNTIWYTTDFASGSDPTDGVTWTEIKTTTPVGSSASMGADGVWTTQSVDLSDITCGTEFEIEIRRQTSATGPTGGAYDSGSNRNGTFWLSDLVYTGSTTKILSVSDKVLNDAVSVYPNPANSRLNINLSDFNINIKNVKLIDVTGKVIYNNNNVETINVKNFSKGLYILKIQSNEGGIFSKKVVIN